MSTARGWLYIRLIAFTMPDESSRLVTKLPSQVSAGTVRDRRCTAFLCLSTNHHFIIFWYPTNRAYLQDSSSQPVPSSSTSGTNHDVRHKAGRLVIYIACLFSFLRDSRAQRAKYGRRKEVENVQRLDCSATASPVSVPENCTRNARDKGTTQQQQSRSQQPNRVAVVPTSSACHDVLLEYEQLRTNPKTEKSISTKNNTKGSKCSRVSVFILQCVANRETPCITANTPRKRQHVGV